MGCRKASTVRWTWAADRAPGMTDATEGWPSVNWMAAAWSGTPWRAQTASMASTWRMTSAVGAA